MKKQAIAAAAAPKKKHLSIASKIPQDKQVLVYFTQHLVGRFRRLQMSTASPCCCAALRVDRCSGGSGGDGGCPEIHSPILGYQLDGVPYPGAWYQKRFHELQQVHSKCVDLKCK
jgi:hypothetical protein